MNLYGFVLNNPVNFIDPLGLAIKCSECEKFRTNCLLPIFRESAYQGTLLIKNAIVGVFATVGAAAATTVATRNPKAGFIAGTAVFAASEVGNYWGLKGNIDDLDEQSENAGRIYEKCKRVCEE